MGFWVPAGSHSALIRRWSCEIDDWHGFSCKCIRESDGEQLDGDWDFHASGNPGFANFNVGKNKRFDLACSAWFENVRDDLWGEGVEKTKISALG